MNDFLGFFDDLVHRFPMHLEITYNKTEDWMIYITKRGCADDFPNSDRDGEDAILVWVQDGDMELCFAKAHVALKEWMIEHNNGY